MIDNINNSKLLIFVDLSIFFLGFLTQVTLVTVRSAPKRGCTPRSTSSVNCRPPEAPPSCGRYAPKDASGLETKVKKGNEGAKVMLNTDDMDMDI